MRIREEIIMRIGLAVCLSFLACVCSCANKPDVESARAVSDQVGNALNSKDTEKLKANLTDDAVLLRNNEPPLVGRDAIVSRYAAGFREIDYDISLISEETQPAGELVIDRGRIEGKVKSKDGRTSMPVSGKYFHVLKGSPGRLWNVVWEFGQPLAKTSCDSTGSRSCCCKDIGGDDCIKNETGCSGTFPIPILLP
jgi:ketosteroid isomerase-like protein